MTLVDVLIPVLWGYGIILTLMTASIAKRYGDSYGKYFIYTLFFGIFVTWYVRKKHELTEEDEKKVKYLVVSFGLLMFIVFAWGMNTVTKAT